MACKYLTGLRIPGCLASDRPMHPSVYELKIFCQKDHEECLVFKKKEGVRSSITGSGGARHVSVLLKEESTDDAVSV
jgi:hypothetical protein